MVPYGLTSDFYFSGHCGFMVLNIMETITHERHYLKVWLMVSFLIYLMVILLLFRVHYSIGKPRLLDLPVGIVFALATYLIVARHCRELDRFASKYIYFGILARILPCLKRTRPKLSPKTDIPQSKLLSEPLTSDIIS